MGMGQKKPSGGARAWIWRVGCAPLLAAGYGVYIGIAYLCSRFLGNAFAGLFAAWGMNAANRALFPAWAQALAANAPMLISIATSALVLLTCALAVRVLSKGRIVSGFRQRDAGLGALLGIGLPALSAGVFLLLDSMRITRLDGPSSILSWIGAVLVSLMAALAEEAFDRAFVCSCVSKAVQNDRWRRLLTAIASSLMLALTTGSASLPVFGWINTLLLGALLADLRYTGRVGISVGFRFGWTAFTMLILSYPGGGGAVTPIFSLYSVSENLLTGGNSGLISGAWCTGVLLLWILMRYRPFRQIPRKQR